MAIKTYDEFLNENLFGAYSYYGAGSLVPIVSKLASEGKSAQQIYSYLTTLGVDEERKRRSISKVFLNESFEFVNEDAVDSLLDKKPEEPKKPSDSAVDADVKKALDDLKSGDDETDKDISDEVEKDEEEESNKIQVLKGALKDAEKLEKIKKILSETFELDFSEETDIEYISGIFEYHSVLEKLSTEERKKLKDNDFVFSDTRSWPIHDEKHAKTALVWATWPQYADKKAAIVKAVLKKYPQLKGVGAAK
jgi:hypothetical protein